MSKQQQVVIVGGGISGIAAARFEVDKGNKVVLIDSSDRPGGLLKSDNVEGHYFDYGTHIIPETGLADLDEILFGHLTPRNYAISKRISAGNFFNGVLNERSCYVDTTTLPNDLYNQGCYDVLSARPSVAESVQGWFDSRYGKTFSREIFCPVVEKYMGVKAAELDVSVGYFFDMSRLLAFNQSTTEKLGEIDQYYAVLGHHVRKEGVTKYYPKKGGVGTLVDDMLDQIETKNFSISLNTKIQQIEQHEGTVSKVVTDKGSFSVDRLIWTIPVTLLAMYVPLGINVEKPTFRKASLFDFVFDKPLLSDVTFINVYDLKMHSGRITLYQNLREDGNNQGSCTVEVLSDKQITEDDILKELLVMGLVADGSQCSYKGKRDVSNGFPVLSVDYVNQSKLQRSHYHDYFKNIHFLGKASEKAFFMTDALKETYNKLVVDAAE